MVHRIHSALDCTIFSEMLQELYYVFDHLFDIILGLDHTVCS